MAKIGDKWYAGNISNSNQYVLEEILVDNLGDYVRKLYKATNEFTGAVHYKGINISKSRIAEDQNKGMTTDDIFKIGENQIENALINGNDANIEFVFHTDKQYRRLLAEDGSYLPTEIKINVHVGNLANEYSSIPGGQNG